MAIADAGAQILQIKYTCIRFFVFHEKNILIHYILYIQASVYACINLPTVMIWSHESLLVTMTYIYRQGVEITLRKSAELARHDGDTYKLTSKLRVVE